MNSESKQITFSVLAGSLGYFVDVFDLVIFGIVRVKSLRSLGVAEEDLVSVGVTLLNAQMGGLLVGGLLWGILGDKRGRLSVLFGCIFLYSAANLANGFVSSVGAYAALRFIAGVGLAGELGAAVTLVSELMSKRARGYGTTVIAGVGLSGAILAGFCGEFLDWRTAYLLGGGMGFALLILRLGLRESRLFVDLKASPVKRGNFLMFFTNRERAVKYLACIAIGVPIWYVAGVLMTFSPELGKELGITGPILASRTFSFSYIGIALGDFLSGALSQWMKNRKRVVLYFFLFQVLLMGVYFLNRGASPAVFYLTCGLLGVGTGYVAVFVTTVCEQFGTNLRATATTTIPNFVRASAIPSTLLFLWWGKPGERVVGAMLVGALVMGIAFFGLGVLKETYGKDLDYVEG